MEVPRYAPLTDDVRVAITNHFALKVESTKSSLLEAQANLERLRSSRESAQPQTLWRRIIMAFGRVIGEPAIEEQIKTAERTVTLTSSRANHFQALVADAQEGRIDRIEADLLKDIEHGFDSLKMRGPGWSPDEDYSGWRRIREAGYLEASGTINLLVGINSPQALPLREKLRSLAEECLAPNYD